MVRSEYGLKQKEIVAGAAEAETNDAVFPAPARRQAARPPLHGGGENVVLLRQLDSNKLATRYGRVCKSLLDKVLGTVILLIALPVLLILALGVKASSPGPVLFTQPRHGLNGREFRIFKFRTMLMHEENTGTVTQAVRSDPRVTRLGAFLRRTSLDELPQLLNVIRGEMSLVGPRPHAVVHDLFFMEHIAGYTDRHAVKPGMTGWAQVHGYRGSIESIESMRKRLEHDRWYIRHWSPLLDFKIMWLTVFNLGHPNAY
jgi:putative colanic acid biosynthesis UDP-glucose lipid carrier transferase